MSTAPVVSELTGATSVLAHMQTLRSCKHQRLQLKTPKQLQHLQRLNSGASASTQFKRGQNTGRNSLRWKGGPFAKYGLSPEQYDAIFAAQGGRCAVCGRPPKKNRLSVDHDHRTGRVRGLLCFRCNYGIGWFQDDLERLRKVSTYLESSHDWRDNPFL